VEREINSRSNWFRPRARRLRRHAPMALGARDQLALLAANSGPGPDTWTRRRRDSTVAGPCRRASTH
jgi:hypothetical protein